MTFLREKNRGLTEKERERERKRERNGEKNFTHGGKLKTPSSPPPNTTRASTIDKKDVENLEKSKGETKLRLREREMKIKERKREKMRESLPRPKMTPQKWRRSRRLPRAKPSGKRREKSTGPREKEGQCIE